jgi:hypothetical protein
VTVLELWLGAEERAVLNVGVAYLEGSPFIVLSFSYVVIRLFKVAVPWQREAIIAT